MKIKRIINNNVVSVIEDGDEKIIMGKGLGFSKKIGDSIDETNIEKVFVLDTLTEVDKFDDLLKEIPVNYFVVSEMIVSKAVEKFGNAFNPSIYITLADHIYNSVIRYKEGITMANGLLTDIKRYYPSQYEIGSYAIDLINKEFDVKLLEDEAGFITLHIINSFTDSKERENVEDITKLLNQILSIIRYRFKQDINEDSIHYDRFITHLKFFSQRVIENKKYDAKLDIDLFNLVKEKYQIGYEVSLKVKEFIEKTYNYNVSNDELLYLTVHIENIIYKNQQ